MGVLTDYFRAPGVAAVQEQMAQRDGGPLISEDSESSAFDGVELKGVDPAVTLGQSTAASRPSGATPDGGIEISAMRALPPAHWHPNALTSAKRVDVSAVRSP